MAKDASKKLFYLYLIMTGMIIGIHSVSEASMGFTGFTKIVNEYMRIFFDAATGAFFFFSAFLLFGKERSYKQLLKSKVHSLAIPYLLFNTLVLLYKKVFRTIVLHHHLPIFPVTELAKDIFLAEANPPLWFMRVLFEFVILYPLIKLVIKDKKIGGAAVCLSIMLHLLIGVDKGYSTVQYWLPIYLLGALMGYHYGNEFCENPKHRSAALLAGLLILLLFIFAAEKSRYIYYFYRIVSPILLWWIFDFFSLLPEPKWWIKCTVFYYGLHICVVSPVSKVYRMFFESSQMMLVLSNILVPTVCIAALICVAAVIRKYIPQAWTILLGGRV